MSRMWLDMLQCRSSLLLSRVFCFMEFCSSQSSRPVLANLFQFAHLISPVSSCYVIKRFSYNGTSLYSRKATARLTARCSHSQARNCGSSLTCVTESANLNWSKVQHYEGGLKRLKLGRGVYSFVIWRAHSAAAEDSEDRNALMFKVR
jgi:hypothetical protein